MTAVEAEMWMFTYLESQFESQSEYCSIVAAVTDYFLFDSICIPDGDSFVLPAVTKHCS